MLGSTGAGGLFPADEDEPAATTAAAAAGSELSVSISSYLPMTASNLPLRTSWQSDGREQRKGVTFYDRLSEIGMPRDCR